MSISKININEFLEFAKNNPVLDVRSPAEYLHAHIPGAISFPIFNNEDRKIIGTAYKQESRERAIKIGLESFGKNMVKMVEEVETIFKQLNTDSREIGVHCWRGGMRSAAIAWLLDLYGYKVYLLVGGYKSYRHWVLQQFQIKHPIITLGGYSGGNKTGVLQELKKSGEAVIDLEGLASHKGSAFGGLGMPEQPSQEHFENNLAHELNVQLKQAGEKHIWFEGESQRIGNLNIPIVLYQNIREKPVLFLDIPFEKRVEHIIEHYGKFEKEKLINAIVRIKKKLGGLETKLAVNALIEDDLKECFSILLRYYDKLYLRSTNKTGAAKTEVIRIYSDTVDAQTNSEIIIKYVKNRKF